MVRPKLSVRVVQFTLPLPIFPLVVVRPKLSVRVVVFTRSLPILPVVVVRPKLSVRVVVLTLCPPQFPVVVVRPKLSVRVVVLQLAFAGDWKAGTAMKVSNMDSRVMRSERVRMFGLYALAP